MYGLACTMCMRIWFNIYMHVLFDICMNVASHIWMNMQFETCINIAFDACMIHDEYSIRYMYEYSMRGMLYALI